MCTSWGPVAEVIGGSDGGGDYDYECVFLVCPAGVYYCDYFFFILFFYTARASRRTT